MSSADVLAHLACFEGATQNTAVSVSELRSALNDCLEAFNLLPRNSRCGIGIGSCQHTGMLRCNSICAFESWRGNEVHYVPVNALRYAQARKMCLEKCLKRLDEMETSGEHDLLTWMQELKLT
jgi:hypothetical protein